MTSTQQLIHQITGLKEGQEAAQMAAIQSLVAEYPAFQLGHWLLAKEAVQQGRATESTLFTPFLQSRDKSYFYFQLWLNEEEENIFEEGKIDETIGLKVPGLAAALSDWKKPISDKDQLDFLPPAQHTIDYFGALGVNLKEEEQNSDDFGKRLRSFSDWLKTMKKLPTPEQAAQPLSEANAAAIRHMASGSVSEQEIITESMAEVWLKQGQPEKAIEVYHKLSLANPAKSHYFADKISVIKRR